MNAEWGAEFKSVKIMEILDEKNSFLFLQYKTYQVLFEFQKR